MSDLILPPGVEYGATPEPYPRPPSGGGVIVNETDLPDEVILDYFVENASLVGLTPGNGLQMYGGGGAGSMMTRPKWRPPGTIIEEIMVCRELADRDDDVSATIGMMTALAFGEGMQHANRDEVSVAMFDEIAKKGRILQRFKEMYREWLIAYQVTTAVVWEQKSISFVPMGADRQRTRTVMVPRVAILPSEQIRVLGNDIFGGAALAYRPFSGRQEVWLQEFFGVDTSPARKAEMRRQDPVLTTLLTEQVPYEDPSDPVWVYSDLYDPVIGQYVYKLNPQLVHRTTGPKGQWQHPRPMMSRNLPLLEAKRLLTVMDYCLLEAGANFLLVVKKGTDARPALPVEMAALKDTVTRASRSGVLLGDHRLSVEIITPKLDELLNADKRKLLGRKLAAGLLRTPDIGSADTAGAMEVQTTTEILSRVIHSDRDDLNAHMEDAVYDPTAERNKVDSCGIWFPKIVLQGLQFFQDMILGLRDRGDIPRKWAVEAAGYDWTAAVEQRKLEKSSGDDKVMTPAAVPFSSPNAGPQDRGGGRPAGAATGKKPATAPGTGKTTVQKNAGETIKAMWDGEDGPIWRAGDLTFAILEEYADIRKVGRVSKFERAAVVKIEADPSEVGVLSEGPVTVIPVNLEYAIEDVTAVRLTEGMSMLVGRRLEDDAIVARAFTFRAPLTHLDAEEAVLRWGYET